MTIDSSPTAGGGDDGGRTAKEAEGRRVGVREAGGSDGRGAGVGKALLGCGVVAGPFYVLVSVAEGLTREGFDLTRHAWSLLSLGDLGWIHVANLLLSGLLVIVFAAGLRRVSRTAGGGWGGGWGPPLVGMYGVGMVGAAVFPADPVPGYPQGTPGAVAEVSGNGVLHFVSAGIGFLCLVAACLVIARRFAAEGRGGWAAFSRVTGLVFLAGFVTLAGGGGAVWANLVFIAALLLASGWLTAFAAHWYGRAVPRATR